jgi:quercetin dioxygenase-like cupin family protein
MRIAIIGGGASGALAALHLARALPVGLAEIIVIEPAEEIGRGLAYSTDDPGHLLNVRAANMSAFADQPDHLFQWLRTKGSCGAGLTPLCFIPRSMYGAYIADIAQRSNRVRAIGPLTRAAFWECIAIPDIRVQCGDLAELIARTPPSGARDIRATAASASVSQQTSQSSREEHPMALTLGGYDRIIRHRGNGIEAVEIVWHPGTRTPKHNHASRGWAWVLQGRVFEVRNGKKLYHAAGDAFLEVDREEAHTVGNDTNDLAVTFHVYQPELQMDMFSDSELDIVAMDLSDISEPNHFAPFSATQLSPHQARND